MLTKYFLLLAALAGSFMQPACGQTISNGEQVIPYAAALTLNVAYISGYVTLSGNVSSLTVPAGRFGGQSYHLTLCQGSGGPYTVAASWSNTTGVTTVATTGCTRYHLVWDDPAGTWVSTLQGQAAAAGPTGGAGAIGATGAAGTAGAAGATGTTGAAGTPATPNTASLPLAITANNIACATCVGFQGAWSSSISYLANVLVSSGGLSYVSLQATTNNTPVSSPTYWQQLNGVESAMTGIRYANSSSADTTVTSAQIQSAIGSGVYQAPLPLTTLGDALYGGASGTATRLAGPTVNGTYVLSEIPTASAAVAPVFTNLATYLATYLATTPGTIDALYLYSTVFSVNATTPVLSGSRNLQTVTLNSNAVPTQQSFSPGMRIVVEICQPATGGPYTWTWPSAYHGGMTIGTAASTCSIQAFTSFNGTTLMAEGSGTTGVSP